MAARTRYRPERITRLEVTDLKHEDGSPDRRIQIYLACGYWYDLAQPLSKPVPDLVGQTSQFHHTHGVKPPDDKKAPVKKPYRKYRKDKE